MQNYRPNNNAQGLRFTDLILAIGVIISGISLFVNNNNNDELEKINDNLTKINADGIVGKLKKHIDGGK